jgi:hypothetical protein
MPVCPDGRSSTPKASRGKGYGPVSLRTAKGRRSGDQFCIYVCDRLIIPSLSPDQLRAIGSGALSLDAMTKQYMHDFLSYRFVATVDRASTLRLEVQVKTAALDDGKPILNPL